MSAAVHDPAFSRESVALASSVAFHLAIGILVFSLGMRQAEIVPIEITLLGLPGPASPPPGDSPGDGPLEPEPAPAPEPEPAPVAKAEPATKPKVTAPKAPPKPAPPPKPIEDTGILGALRKSAPTTTNTRAFEGVESSVRLRERPDEPDAGAATGAGQAASAVDAPVDSRVLSGAATVDAGSRPQAGAIALPGPGGSGSGWGRGGSGTGGGGTGRGGFSVEGAGAGGTGRSYNAIWEHTQQYLAGLRWAYNRELRNDPALRGVLLVRFEILRTGAVGKVELLSSSMKHARLEQEILSQIRGWRYPPESAGDVVVRWPFSFIPPS